MTTPANDGASTVAAGKPDRTRRRFLKRLGATGLMTSAGVFAGVVTANTASASPACCNLANWPENTTYANCVAHASYIWYCDDPGGFLHCSCCETANNAQSAADCRYN